jgi:FAD-dependent urate hydroxylase
MNATLTPEKANAGARARSRKAVCRMTVIGAGPSGLSATAHLRGAGIETRTFGDPMSFWREHMPDGMKLRSSWGASHLSSPDGRHSLDNFIALHNLPRIEPIPVEHFIAYGEWFQRELVPDLDPRRITRIDHDGTRFQVLVDDGESFASDQIVMATGLANQEFVPAAFRNLGPDFVSHTADHPTLAHFKGRRVAVIGRGQSATESAALLRECGADPELIGRGPIRWMSFEAKKSGLMHQLRAPSGVGPFPLDWLVEAPLAWRYCPDPLRVPLSKRCLRPAAAGWLTPRMGGVRLKTGIEVTRAAVEKGAVRLQFSDGSSTVADHVLLATGYVLDISKPGILSPGLLAKVRRHPGTGCPVLSAYLESTVPGLFFTGSSAVPTHGPLLRFVAGVGYSARSIARGAVRR